MSIAIGPIRGLRIAAAVNTRPLDVEDHNGAARAVELDNAGVYRALLGPSWRGELATRGWSVDHAASAWGVERRQWVRVPGASVEGESLGVTDLGRNAAQRALQRASWPVESVDLIVATTSTPSRATSSFASALARELGVDCACLDVRAGGAGGLQALVLAAQMLAAGARRALVVAAETSSPWLDPRDLASALVYGDGAAALALEALPNAASGVECALLGSARFGGTAFTVPGALPPRAGDSYVFQRPDAAYREGLHDTWRLAARELRGRAEHSLARHCAIGAVTREQVELVADELALDARLTLEGLRTRGALGCAGPLATIADFCAASAPQSPASFASLAVGGGVNWVALAWRG